MASYSTTKRHIPYVPSTAGGLGLLLTDFNPNAEIHAGDNTREWLERASGSYVFPADDARVGEFRAPQRQSRTPGRYRSRAGSRSPRSPCASSRWAASVAPTWTS